MSIAAETTTIRYLQNEWQRVADSEELFASVKRWTRRNPLLAHRTPAEIISFVIRPGWARERKRDEALGCLLEHSHEPLSQLMVIQSLLPQVTHLIDRSWIHDADEFAAYVIAIVTEMISGWQKQDIVCVHWWLYRNIQTRVLQSRQIWLQFWQHEAQMNEARIEEEAEQIPEPAAEPGTSASLPDLIALVMRQGSLDRLTAELVVLTRTGCLSVETISRTTGLAPQTLRRRRLRAEKRLRARLSLADFA